jgi:hypothetical protein
VGAEARALVNATVRLIAASEGHPKEPDYDGCKGAVLLSHWFVRGEAMTPAVRAALSPLVMQVTIANRDQDLL